LFEVVGTVDTVGGLTRLLDGRHKHADQQHDDRHDYQQFNQGEGRSRSSAWQDAHGNASSSYVHSPVHRLLGDQYLEPVRGPEGRTGQLQMKEFNAGRWSLENQHVGYGLQGPDGSVRDMAGQVRSLSEGL